MMKNMKLSVRPTGKLKNDSKNTRRYKIFKSGRVSNLNNLIVHLHSEIDATDGRADSLIQRDITTTDLQSTGLQQQEPDSLITLF